jgi:hypothetical protein
MLEMLSPKLVEAVKSEFDSWKRTIKDFNISIDAIIPQMQAFLATLVEMLANTEQEDGDEEAE